MRHEVGDFLGPESLCPMCDAANLIVCHVYECSPELETKFPLLHDEKYWREMYRCNQCGHYIEGFFLDQSRLYEEEYVTSLYNSAEGILEKYNYINSLSYEKSDNKNRLDFVNKYVKDNFKLSGQPSHLDIGAGLGVFINGMKENGWCCMAVDMDRRLVEHYTENIKIRALRGSFEQIPETQKFDLISLNKVLEHVENPISMLKSAANYLNEGALIYIELPDGEAAEAQGFESQEFLLGHRHVFSFLSFVQLIQKSELRLKFLERICEPSSKLTLRGFAYKR